MLNKTSVGIGLFLISISAVACPCFHRFYLYSIFQSEQQKVTCEGTGRGFYSRMYIKSHQNNASQLPSNFGEASSSEYRCMLRVDNQSITRNYANKAEKVSCDEEIARVCFCLKHYHSKMSGISCL